MWETMETRITDGHGERMDKGNGWTRRTDGQGERIVWKSNASKVNGWTKGTDGHGERMDKGNGLHGKMKENRFNVMPKYDFSAEP